MSSKVLQIFSFRDRFFLLELRNSFDPPTSLFLVQRLFVRDELGLEEEVKSIFDLEGIRCACENLLREQHTQSLEGVT